MNEHFNFAIFMKLKHNNQILSCLTTCMYFFVKDIDRLARTGLTMTSKSLTNKLASWEDCLYMSVEKIREGWERGEKKKISVSRRQLG